MTEYFKIGKIVSAFGLTGEVVLSHSLGKKTNLKGLKTLFLEDKKDSFLPYFIESARAKSDTELYVKLEEVNTREQALRVLQKEIWLPEAEFKKFAAKSAPISLLGYKMINDGQLIGEIAEVIEQPHQVLCKIFMGDNEALIPVHEETLVNIDNKKKEVFVTLPPGLLELYTG